MSHGLGGVMTVEVLAGLVALATILEAPGKFAMLSTGYGGREWLPGGVELISSSICNLLVTFLRGAL